MHYSFTFAPKVQSFRVLHEVLCVEALQPQHKLDHSSLSPTYWKSDDFACLPALSQLLSGGLISSAWPHNLETASRTKGMRCWSQDNSFPILWNCDFPSSKWLHLTSQFCLSTFVRLLKNPVCQDFFLLLWLL
jgi:hypothetical protein